MVYLYCRVCKEVTEHRLEGNKGQAGLPFKPDAVVMQCTECGHSYVYRNEETEE